VGATPRSVLLSCDRRAAGKSSGCRGRASGARYSARTSRARWPGGFCGSNRPPSWLTKCAGFPAPSNS